MHERTSGLRLEREDEKLIHENLEVKQDKCTIIKMY